MQALLSSRAPGAHGARTHDAAFVPGADGILVIHASSHYPALRGSTLAAGDVVAPRDLDRHALRRRPPRAVVIDARGQGVDLAGVSRFLVEAGLSGTVPVLLAAPLEVVGDLDDDGLDVDDFVVVPYTTAEIAARLQRIERRWQQRAGDGHITIGGLHVDTFAHRVALYDRAVALTRLEYALLVFFLHHRGRVFTRDELLARVWGSGGPAGGRTVDIHVRRLRAKLGDGISSLETVRGVGYRFMAALGDAYPVQLPVQ